MSDDEAAKAGARVATEKLTDAQIEIEGYLKVRANKGIAGMRPWLQRYFVLCNHDFTLRRYGSADEVDNPKKAPRLYELRDIVEIGQDLPPRFFLLMKSRRVDAEGDPVKLSAETDAERQVRDSAWRCARQGRGAARA
jgi:hypothetical protein